VTDSDDVDAHLGPAERADAAAVVDEAADRLADENGGSNE
jgi:hypothetical protein